MNDICNYIIEKGGRFEVIDTINSNPSEYQIDIFKDEERLGQIYFLTGGGDGLWMVCPAKNNRTTWLVFDMGRLIRSIDCIFEGRNPHDDTETSEYVVYGHQQNN